jgi:hypothetical protein
MPQRTNRCDLKNSVGYSSSYNDLDDKSIICRYEIRIIDCIKARSRTQKSISHKIGLNSSIICELIDDLLLKGHVHQTRKRRLYFWHSDLFSATLEGLAIVERAKKES